MHKDSCLICGGKYQDGEYPKKDDLVYDLQLASARSQGCKGWVCPKTTCLKKAGISYKTVNSVMSQVPDYAWRARRDMGVVVDAQGHGGGR